MSQIAKQIRRVMTSKQEILDYLNISDKLFRKFIKSGMPALFVDGRWYAHADNIDAWFQRLTMINNQGKDPEEVFFPKTLSSD